MVNRRTGYPQQKYTRQSKQGKPYTAGRSSIQIYYFSIRNKVTGVGLRLDIARYLPDELELRVDNLSNSEVMVYLRGRVESIERFYNFLTNKRLGEAKHYSFSKLIPLGEKGCFNVDTNRFFHKLECEQLGKFVNVGLGMRKDMSAMRVDIRGMSENMKKDIRGMSENMKKLITVLQKG